MRRIFMALVMFLSIPLFVSQISAASLPTGFCPTKPLSVGTAWKWTKNDAFPSRPCKNTKKILYAIKFLHGENKMNNMKWGYTTHWLDLKHFVLKYRVNATIKTYKLLPTTNPTDSDGDMIPDIDDGCTKDPSSPDGSDPTGCPVAHLEDYLK